MEQNRSQKLFYSLEELINDVFGQDISIIRMDSVPGGDINNAYRLSLSNEDSLFVKTNSVNNLNFFLTESGGLRALRSLKKIGVPEVLGAGTDEQRGISFLALEYIESSSRTPSYWENFGHQLAGLHRAECRAYVDDEESGAKFGFYEDNYIGATPQKNYPEKSWIDFYRECRLLPQITMAEKYLEPVVRKKADRLLELQDYEETRKRYAVEAGEAEAALLKLCRSLSEKRRIAAEKLSEAVCRELRDLGFESVSFRAEFGEREPSPEGTDTVCFMTSLNPGEKERPLQEVASGGELSRIMLALKTVLAETDDIPTLIFDEIDTGISGRTAQKVAEKLDIISGGHQVICITHLPQIAAMADRHFVIQKEAREGRNETEIRPLSGENSLSELTRLLGGARITEAVLQNAREMKELAQKEKKMHKEARKKKDEL